MKETDAREFAEKEIENAKERLEAAKILLEKGKVADSINRAYYAMFHAARAFLIINGEEAKTQEGLISKFSLLLLKENLPKDLGRMFRQVFEARESSDYRVSVIFEKEDAIEAYEKAKKFVDELAKIIKEKITDNF